MDVNQFLQQLLEELSHLPFVKNLDLNTELLSKEESSWKTIFLSIRKKKETNHGIQRFIQSQMEK
ncbi:MAG: hypothetical protein JSV88_21885 [Candidatus Aminicenantes bacterium]|nr:MAG: hypothetical protein JSV88_21885 [Candidatus Aminicenantes bacterium]